MSSWQKWQTFWILIRLEWLGRWSRLPTTRMKNELVSSHGRTWNYRLTVRERRFFLPGTLFWFPWRCSQISGKFQTHNSFRHVCCVIRMCSNNFKMTKDSEDSVDCGPYYDKLLRCYLRLWYTFFFTETGFRFWCGGRDISKSLCLLPCHPHTAQRKYQQKEEQPLPQF